jgi:hypothetical protein
MTVSPLGRKIPMPYGSIGFVIWLGLVALIAIASVVAGLIAKKGDSK